MIDEMANRHLFGWFADILDYPHPRLLDAIQRCEALLATRRPDATALLGEFRRFVEVTPAGLLEEVYSGTFDLGASCHPYIGYHLFGETYQRSAFLVGLRESFAPLGFSEGTELPDHLAVLLRFLAICDEAQAEELVRFALIPAMSQMIGDSDPADPVEDGEEPLDLGEARRAYRRVLQALLLCLRDWQSTRATQSAGPVLAEESAVPS